MTQEEKNLLLQDLCERLPHGVIVKFGSNPIEELTDINLKTFIFNGFGAIPIPFLRPMSSMSDEEKKEFESLGWRVDELDGNVPWNHNAYNVFDGVDWLNKKMFDYRGLIPMGLALESQEGMYK